MVPFVLIVADDLETRLRLATALAIHGQEVSTASNSAEALADARDHRPSLIVVELSNPTIGSAFRIGQLQDPSLENIPVMWSSPNGDKDLADGFSRFRCVRGPVQVDDILGWIDRLDEGGPKPWWASWRLLSGRGPGSPGEPTP